MLLPLLVPASASVVLWIVSGFAGRMLFFQQWVVTTDVWMHETEQRC
jgi:hypothetical protein